MSDLKQARTLLEAGKRTYRRFEVWATRSFFAGEKFGFDMHQAAEKLLHARLASLGEIYPLTHELASLLDMLRKRGADVARFDDLVDDTGYAVRSRYTSVRRHGFMTA